MSNQNNVNSLLAKKVQIPPRPEVLVAVTAESKKPEPDINIIANKIGSDVSLSAAVLQIVNSPAYGLGNKVTNILQACNLLGIDRVNRIVTVVSMRNTVTGDLNLARFWDSATEIANICSQLAVRLSGIDKDDAYTLGLFHDCGIPLMMQAFKDYKHVLIEMNKTNVYPRTKVEEKYFQMSHNQVGYQLLGQWFLPKPICIAAFYHHFRFNDLVRETKIPSDALSLLAILKMAEDISQTFRQAWRSDAINEWELVKGEVLQYMGIDDSFYEEIKGDLLDDMKFDED